VAIAPPFDADRVAFYEAHGWRAYYDRDWPRLLRLIVGLCQEQFHIPFPQSLRAAYFVTRASIAWVPADHDEARVQYFYQRFYEIARRYSGLTFDPAVVAALELRYNDVHRRLSGQPDKTEFIQVMTELHSAIFSIAVEAARLSAEERVLANNTVDEITSERSPDPEADWEALEAHLRACYRSIAEAVAAQTDATSAPV
jgi:hypothetical protein